MMIIHDFDENDDDDDVDDDVDDYSYMTMMIMLKIWGRVCYQLQEGRRRLLLVPNFLACRWGLCLHHHEYDEVDYDDDG